MRACPSGLGQKRTAAVNVTADRNGLRRSMTLAAEKWTLNFRTPRNLIHNKQNHCGTCRQKSTHSARCFAPHIHYLPGMLQLCQMLPNATARPVKSLILSSQRGRSQVWVGLCSPFQQTYCKHPKHLESSEPRYKPTYLSGHAAQQKNPLVIKPGNWESLYVWYDYHLSKTIWPIWPIWGLEVKIRKSKIPWFIVIFHTHRIHVWYIYANIILMVKYGKCYHI